MLKPEWGIWFFLIALLPWGLRIVAGRFPFRRTSLDVLIAIFLATAWVGYWAAYDKPVAWSKLWLIMTAALFYYALVAQPRENLFGLSLFFFCVGVGVSIYYFLTQDFIAAPRKLEVVNQIGRWMMSFRPQTGWKPIHPNYVAGLIAILTPFVAYPLRMEWKKKKMSSRLLYFFAFLGMGIVIPAFVMATSRGATMAVISGLGICLVWRFINFNGIRNRVKKDAVFASVVLVYLSLIVLFLYLGPANSGSVFSSGYYYGNGSRAELLSRSFYLLDAYPFTGGGLGAFPGLYSLYILDIPFFNVANSHNLFLDVAIEQGIFGGASFILLYLAGIWFVSRSLMHGMPADAKLFSLIILFALVVVLVHGMVDDYLFNGNGALFSLFLLGFTVPAARWRFPDVPIQNGFDNRIIAFGLMILTLLIVLNPAKTLSIWYANLGAVQSSRMELDGFPKNGWLGTAIVPRLTDATKTLHAALRYDPDNLTANQQLGLIYLLNQDFESATDYLEASYSIAPQHRGIVKSLGYCYVWLGDIEKARMFLSQIPEAREELGVYVWWWNTQGRNDLSENAVSMLSKLNASPGQP